MTHKVLIDYDVKGWAQENENRIRADYREILMVGDESNPPMDSEDNAIASFCEEEDCDLLTGDKRAYTELLRNHLVKAVQISKYDWYQAGNKQVYLIKIL